MAVHMYYVQCMYGNMVITLDGPLYVFDVFAFLYLAGSLTLLKWKLLATPHLGGATSFFSSASRPGIHVKGHGLMDSSVDCSSSIEEESFSSAVNSSKDSSITETKESTPIKNTRDPVSVSSHSQGLVGILGGEVKRGMIVRSPKVSRTSPRMDAGIGLASLLEDSVD